MKEIHIKMVQGLGEINRKLSTQFKLHELGEKETERLITRNKKSETEKHLQHVELKLPYRGKKTGHKINRVKLLVGENFSHLHIKLVTFPRLNFGF